MRILACGDRYWNDYDTVASVLAETIRERRLVTVNGQLPSAEPVTILEGGARGADACAARFAHETTEPLVDHSQFVADWAHQGRAAGPIRNQRMLDEGKPDVVIAFHNDLPNSRGTRDMVNRAIKAGIRVRTVLSTA